MKRPLLLAASCAAIMSASAPALADTDMITGGEHAGSVIPRVLSSEDGKLYRSIFAEERSGNSSAARREIAELSDHSLMGYVEAEHYLSRKGRKAPLKELAIWLERNDELPIAAEVREVAEKHNHRRHRVELAGFVPARPRGGWGYETADTLREQPMSTEAERAAEMQIDNDMHLDLPAQAEGVLQTLAAAGGSPSTDIARLTHRVAASYLAEGMDSDAYRVAMTVGGTDRYAAPILDWDAGLAAYRLSNFTDAATHFETLAQSGEVTGWARSAAAFWAARAHLAAGDPLPVVSLLTAAAREQPTFYGLLAERLLGQQSQAQFNEPVLDSTSFESIVHNEAAHRAVALWQIGETQYVQPEMMRAFASVAPGETAAFAALAHNMDLPDLELRASETQAARGEMLSGLFPMPRYAPPGGYRMDPCLVLAFARVESRFEAKAVSRAGARGVMQIMPGTAKHEDGAMPRKTQLNDPAYSLGLGQRYLEELLGQVNGNLFQLAAAYNAGPGALTHWIGTRPSIVDDPLLFIESIPVSETRNYIKRVMAFYWLYARRAGEKAPSLEDTAEGKWPMYQPQPGTNPPAIAGTQLISDASVPH